jgi:acetyl esterase
MTMRLDPELAAIFAPMPPMPSVRTMGIPQYRAMINGVIATAPRHDAPLAKVEDRTIATAAGAIPVRVYSPLGEAPFPLLVYYHGGGFVIGDLNISDTMCRALCSGVGAVVMSVDYRLAPENPFPAAHDDCYAALCWAAVHAAEIGGDAARLAVVGDSAGANLSAAMTLRACDRGGPPIAAQFLMYPSPEYPDITKGSYKELADAPMLASDDVLFYWEQYLRDGASRTDPDACPIHAKSLARLPPAFVAIAECDPTKDAADAYADALRAAGVDTVKRLYPGMPHGFYFWIAHSRVARDAMAEACAWLSGHFKAPVPVPE